MEIVLDTNAWVFLGGTVATVGSVAIAHINSKRRQDSVEQKVDETVALSKPTGNGFAQSVKDSLARVELAQAALVTEVSALKEKVSDQAVAHARLEGKFDGAMTSVSSRPATVIPQQLALPAAPLPTHE